MSNEEETTGMGYMYRDDGESAWILGGARKDFAANAACLDPVPPMGATPLLGRSASAVRPVAYRNERPPRGGGCGGSSFVLGTSTASSVAGLESYCPRPGGGGGEQSPLDRALHNPAVAVIFIVEKK